MFLKSLVIISALSLSNSLYGQSDLDLLNADHSNEDYSNSVFGEVNINEELDQNFNYIDFSGSEATGLTFTTGTYTNDGGVTYIPTTNTLVGADFSGMTVAGGGVFYSFGGGSIDLTDASFAGSSFDGFYLGAFTPGSTSTSEARDLATLSWQVA